MKTIFSALTFIFVVASPSVFAQTADSSGSSNTSDTTTSWQQVSQSGATGAATGGCSSNVQSQIGAAQTQFIAGQQQLGGSGYTTTGDFSDATCLNNILGGLNLTLSLPNMTQILNQIENEACAKAEQAEQNATTPLTNIISSANSSMNIPSYQLIPGVSTGATSGGVYVSEYNGYGQNPVVLNIAGGLDNGSYHSTASFGSGLISNFEQDIK